MRVELGRGDAQATRVDLRLLARLRVDQRGLPELTWPASATMSRCRQDSRRWSRARSGVLGAGRGAAAAGRAGPRLDAR